MPLSLTLIHILTGYTLEQSFSTSKKKSDLVKSIKEISRTLKVGGKVKLQFMMASPPKFGKMLKKDSFAFENFSINHERYTKFIVPIWKVKLTKSNNWLGTRLGYRQLMREFRKNGIDILGIAKQPPHKRYIWVYGEKVETR